MSTPVSGDRAGLKALLPMASDGVGPSYTCSQIMSAIGAAGLATGLWVNRDRARTPGLPTRAAVPQALSFIPYRMVEAKASKVSEASYLRALEDGDVAYLWPAASMALHEAVARRGNPIVMEGINTRMAFAREILDQAYDSLGLPPAHGITDERIAEEDAKLAGASAFFAPSEGVERALEGSPFRGALLTSSYGVALGERLPEARRPVSRPVDVLFVGYACVRKGFPALLEAWRAAAIAGRLTIVGKVEKAIATRYADILNRPDVRCVGFQRSVAMYYRTADIFVQPALEEGDPLVTYEAASHGLPILASPMGGGRMVQTYGCALRIDPYEPGTIADALSRISASPELRLELSQKAVSAVRHFSWSEIGARRAEALVGSFPQLWRKPAEI